MTLYLRIVAVVVLLGGIALIGIEGINLESLGALAILAAGISIPHFIIAHVIDLRKTNDQHITDLYEKIRTLNKQVADLQAQHPAADE